MITVSVSVCVFVDKMGRFTSDCCDMSREHFNLDELELEELMKFWNSKPFGD